MTARTAQRTIVLGAGPTGLAAALLLAGQGRSVTVYEAKDELVLDSVNSYPIGVNRRGQETLRRINPALLKALRDEGEMVAAFHIFSGERCVAELPSRTLLATTRAHLTAILLEKAQATAGVNLVLGHRLTGVDLAARTLTFKTGGEQVTVPADDAQVIAADGVWSVARRSLAEQVPGFFPRVKPWGLKFRVAFSAPGAAAAGMDPAIHYIFTSRGIYTATLRDGVWGVVVTAIEGDDAEETLLSTDASPENVELLRAHLREHATRAEPLLTEEDLKAFFDREPFSGAVVICPQVAFEEWLVLVGDAAHSVIPATGEGVNSGLEDALVLAGILEANTPNPLTAYERTRLPDLHALGEYAWVLCENITTRDPARGPANVVLRIADAVAAKLPGEPSAQVEATLFGPKAARTPYREAIGPWIRQRRALYPTVRGVVARVQGLVGHRGR